MKVAIFLDKSKINFNLINNLCLYYKANSIQYVLFEDSSRINFKSTFINYLKYIYILGYKELYTYIIKYQFSSLSSTTVKVSNVNSVKFIDTLSSMQFTHGLSISFGQIFKNEIISFFNNNLVNLHSSYLPSNKGLMPCFWSLFKNDVYSGVTLHKVDIKIDHGQIIAQKTFRLSKISSYMEMLEVTRLLSICILIDYYNSFVSHPKSLNPSYNSFPSFSDISQYRKQI
mgnify:CR=1 FL=1|tara:strand:+ start:300 stop:986 length:687 start_codon:yes stop_codon:yes gene_type:complete